MLQAALVLQAVLELQVALVLQAVLELRVALVLQAVLELRVALVLQAAPLLPPAGLPLRADWPVWDGDCRALGEFWRFERQEIAGPRRVWAGIPSQNCRVRVSAISGRRLTTAPLLLAGYLPEKRGWQSQN